MTDLDIQIDVPDDDGLNTPVHDPDNGWLPPWFKAAALLVVGALAAIMIGGYLIGRAQRESPDGTTSSSERPLASAAASPAIDRSLGAVRAWGTFAQSGNLADVKGWFDETGPQYQLFQASAKAPAAGSADKLQFVARNPAETKTDTLTTVSMDLLVTSARGQETFPYDFVFRNGSDKVWTVVDRRSPGSVALPPDGAAVTTASQNWALFTNALAINDGPGAAGLVSEPTRQLANQILAALGKPASATVADPGEPLNDGKLFAQLVTRARAAGAKGAGEVIISLLDTNQRRALVTGQLGTWTQVDANRVVATLAVEGQPTATVPFVSTGQGWAFDLVGALKASKGGA